MARPVVISRRAIQPAFAAVVIGLPFVIVVLALAAKKWFPVMDMALTDMRVRDVGTAHTPLIGMPGTLGTAAVQGSHPGPLSFYLLAPLYRVFSQRPFTLLLGSALIQAAAAFGFVAVTWRVAGRRVGLASVAVMAVLIHGYGAGMLSQPTRSFLPLLAWALMIVCVWGVLSGHPRLIAVIAISGSLCAQTHTPYAGICLGMAVMAMVGLTVNVKRETDIDRRVDAVQWAIGSAALAVVLWAPTVVDQVLHKPGNLRILDGFLRKPSGNVIGTVAGGKLILRHFDVFRLILGTRLHSGNIVFGFVGFVLWVVSFVFAARLRHWLLVTLDVVLAWAVILGAYSLGRVAGDVHASLSLWGWSISAVALLATLWTAWAWVRVKQPAIALHVNPLLTLATCTVASLAILAGCVEARHVTPPSGNLGAPLDRLIAPTAKAISLNQAGAQGKRGKYLVTWEDTYFGGAQGYGLLTELERRGYHVGTTADKTVQVTKHRTLARSAAATNIVLAVGHSIDDVASRPGAVLIAATEPRTAAQITQYNRLHDEVVAGLTKARKISLVALVDGDLNALATDRTVPAAVAAKIAKMSALGQRVAVFFVPLTT
jgi:hypothetical protein